MALRIGDKAIPFRLKGVDDKEHSLEEFSGKRVLVVVFTCNHCPYAQAYQERIKKIQEKFGARQVQVIAINSNDALNYPDDGFEQMKDRAKEKQFNFPYLHDESQEIAKAYGALVTPHIFMFGTDRKLIYQGGVDDNWEHPEQATKHFLKDALTEATEGKEVTTKTSPVVGCSVKWK